MTEYVERNSYVGLFKGEHNPLAWEEIEEFMDSIPSADVVPVKRVADDISQAFEYGYKKGKHDTMRDCNISTWIPVTERLPESVCKSYLCLTDTGYHCEVRWTNNVYGL